MKKGIVVDPADGDALAERRGARGDVEPQHGRRARRENWLAAADAAPVDVAADFGVGAAVVVALRAGHDDAGRGEGVVDAAQGCVCFCEPLAVVLGGDGLARRARVAALAGARAEAADAAAVDGPTLDRRGRMHQQHAERRGGAAHI